MTSNVLRHIFRIDFWTRGTSSLRLALILSALIHFCLIFAIYGKITEAILGAYRPSLHQADHYLDVELIDERDLLEAQQLQMATEATPTPK